MTMEKIDPPPAPPEEPAAIRAARMIKELHLEQIAKMNSGFVFTKTVNGVTSSCNEEIRVACMEQIERCNDIIDTASKVPPHMLEQIGETLKGVQENANDLFASFEKQDLPEIGNYDHKTD